MTEVSKPKLLWFGDAVVSSGFARATDNILHSVKDAFDVGVIAINYNGDPHPFSYPVYPARNGGDFYGIGRLQDLTAKLRPDVIVIQQDPWNIGVYIDELDELAKAGGKVPPVVGAIAVDGKNVMTDGLNRLQHVVFWTNYADTEAKKYGLTTPSSVIPLGVDLSIYKPLEKSEVRAQYIEPVLKQLDMPMNSFVIGVVGRNQIRKRLDLTIQYFAEWINTRKIDDACLWLHIAPTGDKAYDLTGLAQYYETHQRVFIPEIFNPAFGVGERTLAKIYNMFDVLFSTTTGEGFGLPMLEAMSCGVPCIVPEWSALADWAAGIATLVPCSSTMANVLVGPKGNGVTTIGGLMDKELALRALDTAYANREKGKQFSNSLQLALRPTFRWKNIGEQWVKVLTDVLQKHRTTIFVEHTEKEIVNVGV